MEQPWLQVTLQDYEGHMGASGVGQLAPLADLFAEALAFCRPRSVAIVGIDINADYLAAVSRSPTTGIAPPGRG